MDVEHKTDETPPGRIGGLERRVAELTAENRTLEAKIRGQRAVIRRLRACAASARNLVDDICPQCRCRGMDLGGKKCRPCLFGAVRMGLEDVGM